MYPYYGKISNSRYRDCGCPYYLGWLDKVGPAIYCEKGGQVGKSCGELFSVNRWCTCKLTVNTVKPLYIKAGSPPTLVCYTYV